jgi:ribonucleotide monophosphatase NagD (HAD superfamily)
VEAATGVKAKIMGKPHSPMILEALARLGSKSEETAIVGDNLVEDMSAVRMFREATGQNLHSFLVLSGVATRDDASKLLNPPTGIFDNLQAVVKHLEETRNR